MLLIKKVRFESQYYINSKKKILAIGYCFQGKSAIKLLVFLLLLTSSFIVSGDQQAIKSPLKDLSAPSLDKGMQLTFKEIRRILERNYSSVNLNSELSKAWAMSLAKNIDEEKIMLLQGDVEKNRIYFDESIFNDSNKLVNAFDLFMSAGQAVDKILGQLPNWIADSTPSLSKNDIALYQDWPQSSSELELRWKAKISQDISRRTNQGVQLELARKHLLMRYKSLLNDKKNKLVNRRKEDFFNALLTIIDPLTIYYAPLENNGADILKGLNLVGLGLVLQDDNGDIKVLRSVAGGPADKSGGVRAGDIIVGVTDENSEPVDVRGMLLDQVVKLLRGKIGSNVTLTMLRDKGVIEVALTRNKVKLVEQKVNSRLEKIEAGNKLVNIGVLSIPRFYMDFQAYRNRDPNYRSSAKDVIREIIKLNQNNVSGIVVDLRDNRGGPLKEGGVVSDIFLPKGTILQLKNTRTKFVDYAASKNDPVYQGPLVIVVDKKSAGAAEIFAGAVQDYNRGLIVGDNTFGMGNIYALKPLSSGGSLKYIDSSMYRVSGFSFYPNGVEPDILIGKSSKNKESRDLLKPHLKYEVKINSADYYKLNQSYDKNKIYEQYIKRSKGAGNKLKKIGEFDSTMYESIQILLDMIENKN